MLKESDAEKRLKKLETKILLFERKKREETDELYRELLDDKLHDLTAMRATETKKVKRLRKHAGGDDDDDIFDADGLTIVKRTEEKLKLADELCEYIMENMRLSSCNKDALCTLILKFNAIEIVGESYEEKVRIIRNMKKPELIDDQSPS
jgi:hypothetical protein